jgi:hypothetical protein
VKNKNLVVTIPAVKKPLPIIVDFKFVLPWSRKRKKKIKKMNKRSVLNELTP